MNQLTAVPTNGRHRSDAPAHRRSQPADPLNGLPGWLKYLVGAFPTADVNKATFAVYEEQFRAQDDDLMLAAVKDVVRTHKYATFPTVAEIWTAIEAYAVDVKPPPQLPMLNLRRQQLLDAAYQGSRYDPDDWDSLHNAYLEIGYDISAAYLRRRQAIVVEMLS